jgi:isopenicillin-N N-acyltransferase-like protein
VNVRGEVGVFDKTADALSGCTAFAAGPVATADRGVLVGQNQDQGQVARELVVILRIEPDRGPRMLMATFGGLLGYGGINSAGVGMMQNQLANSSWRFGLPHYPLKRALLEQESLAGCVDVFKRAKLGSCTNYVLVDRDGVMDIEATPDGFAILGERADCIAHANHFLDPELAKDERLLSVLPDSAGRSALLGSMLDARRGQICLDDAKAWLSNHEGFPTSLCRHATSSDPTEISTLYSVICEADKGLMHVAAGNPCKNSFHTYSLN